LSDEKVTAGEPVSNNIFKGWNLEFSMAIEREIEGEVFDSFYGRSFNVLGGEHYVCLDLESGGVSSIDPSSGSFYGIVRNMIHDVRNDRKILLDKSPGYREQDGANVYFVPFSPATQGLLRTLVDGVMSGNLMEDIFLETVKRD